jgi:hypothetical protein
MELAALDVVDSRQKLDGELAVHIRQGIRARTRRLDSSPMANWSGVWCLSIAG